MSIIKEPNFVCGYCGLSGYKPSHELKRYSNHFCNRKCSINFRDKRVEKKCDYCGVLFFKRLSEALKTKNHFCNKECADKFQDKRIERECDYCNVLFLISASVLVRSVNNFCSLYCRDKFRDKKENVICLVCGVTFKKTSCDIIRKPRHFCSFECRKLVNNFKDWGGKRSKLEIAIEKHFKDIFPFMYIRYNKTDISHELDIYVPCLELAIELNGPLHYRVIYKKNGEERLRRTQQIDREKVVKCREIGIKLFVINVSEDKDNKKVMSQRILEVEGIVKDRIRELGYVGQMVLEI